jgi:hypothetical protein
LVLSNSSRAYDLLDVQGRGSPEEGRSQLQQITKPESGRQGRGTRSKSCNQSDKSHEQTRTLRKLETVIREQKMRAKGNPERVQVEEDSAPRNWGVAQSRIEAEELEPEEEADGQTMAAVATDRNTAWRLVRAKAQSSTAAVPDLMAAASIGGTP